MRTHLLALSFDAVSSPTVHFDEVPSVHVAGRVPCGWGFAWYPEGDRAAAVVKDPNSTGEDALVRTLHDWSRFSSTIHIAFVLGAAHRRTQQDTHPFHIRYASRDWVLTHNGQLEGFREGLPLGEDSPFEPAGETDSEHVLCWLVRMLHDAGARTLSGFGWIRLFELFARANSFGSANLVLTDGRDLVAYHDRSGYNQMYWTRRPPTAPREVQMGLVRLDLGDAADRNRTAVIFSSQPPEEEEWEQMQPGQMLVARRGAVRWDSVCGGPPAPRKAIPVVRPNGHLKAGPVAPELPTFLPPHILRPETGNRYRIVHETCYSYAQPIERSVHMLRLLPVHDSAQELLEYSLDTNVRGIHHSFEDVFGNHSVQIDVEERFSDMRVVSRALVHVRARAYDALEFPNRRMRLPLVWMPWQRQMMEPYLLPPELPETELLELSEFAMGAVGRCDSDVLETMMELNSLIFQDFEYVPGATSISTTPYQVFCSRRGVCQDFANLLICLARLLGIPARYRVGYIFTGGYQNLAQGDASHAWVELYLPWIGWRGFDPTNGYMVGADHIRVACGRNYRDATPTSGTIFKGGGGERMSVQVRVEPADP
ncbi:MAG: class II glutamine amidotransferase [Candidatus Xenobia bacterium]